VSGRPEREIGLETFDGDLEEQMPVGTSSFERFAARLDDHVRRYGSITRPTDPLLVTLPRTVASSTTGCARSATPS